VVGTIVFLLLGIDELPEGGADAETLLVSGVVAIAFAAAVVAWFRWRHPAWRGIVGLPTGPPAWRDVAWGAVAGVVLYPVVSIVAGTVVVILLRSLTGGSVETPDQLSPDLTGAGRALAAVYAILVAPVVEELYYRGVLFRGLLDRRGFPVAAAVSSLVFGLVHWPLGEPLADALVLPIVMTVTGFGLAWIYARRRTLVAPIAAHMAFNAIGIVLIFSGIGS
jgi:membrane protease YdiL (CAAX protease family)